MRRLWFLVLGLAACGKSEVQPAPDTAPVAIADAAPAVDVEPAKPSKIDAAKALLGKSLAADPTAIKDALALADELAAEETPEAKVSAARIRLVAVARALDADPAGAALGEGGAERLLRLVLTTGDVGPEGKRVADVARGLLALSAAPDHGAKLADLRPLMADATPEGQALRLVALKVLPAALDAGSTTAGFETLMRRAGPLLCDGCGDAAVLGPEQLTAIAAKPYSDGVGFACAPNNPPGFGSPCDAVAALATVPAAGDGANVLVLAAIELEAALRQVEPGPAPLGEALAAAAQALPKRDGHVLPVAVGDLGTLGLGKRGLALADPALAVAVVGPDGVRIGTRPLVASGGALVAIGEPLASAPLTAPADIVDVAPDPATGAVPVLAERAKAVGQVVADTTIKPQLPKLAGGAVELAILPGAAPKVVIAAADALGSGGLTTFAVMRPGVVGGALPLHLRAVKPEVEAPLVNTWEKPIVIVVSAEAIDIWGPERAKEGGLPVGADAQPELPTTAEAGWRGETLARLRVPIPPAAAPVDGAAAPAGRIPAPLVQDIRSMVEFWVSRTKVGPVVHVVAGPGAESWDVLTLAQAIQEAPKKEGATTPDLAAVWPGARCPGEAQDCASALVVAFSGIAVASERGLTNKPKKADKGEPVVKEPEPAPSDEYCNKADIQTQMRKRAGSIRFCYEKELQLEKDLQGKLTARFTIDRGGKVASISTSGDLPSKSVAECVKNEIKKVAFAPPDGGVCVVNWPFVFRAN